MDHVDRPDDAVGDVDGQLWNKCHIVAVVDGKSHVDVELPPLLQLLHENGDEDVDGDNRSVGEPSVVAAVAGRMPLFADWVR